MVEGRSKLEKSLEGMEGVEASERIVWKGRLKSVTLLQSPPPTALPQNILHWLQGDQKILAQNFPAFLRAKKAQGWGGQELQAVTQKKTKSSVFGTRFLWKVK